jgi:PAS domain S-box-containing protein
MLDFLFQTAGLLLITLRGSIPDWASIYAANLLVVTGSMIGLEGLKRFTGHQGSRSSSIVFLGAFAVALAYLSFLRPDLTMRSVITTSGLFFFCARSAVFMLTRVESSMRPFTRLVGIVFGIYSLVFFTRAGWLLWNPFHTGDYVKTGSLEAVFHVVTQMLFVLLTYSLALMVNRRLLIEIRMQEEKFSAAFHSAPYAILLTRLADGKILEVNRGFSRITGYSPEEVRGRTTVDLDLWTRVEDRQTVVRELADKGALDEVEMRIRVNSGGIITGMMSASVIIIHGEKCILSSVSDITERRRSEEERERLLQEREKTLSEVKVLSGLLPICASCKKIRDDSGYWNQIEGYLLTHSQAEFSHGLCPDCMEKIYPGMSSRINEMESDS